MTVSFRRPAEPRRVRVGGLRLHVLDWPAREPRRPGVPLLLLHPNRTNARVWDFVVEASALSNRFIAPDQRGHGLSDWPELGYQLDDYVADDLALLDALGLERVILVGAATGGNVALLLASRRPDRVAALVVADPGLSLDPAINATVQAEIRRQERFPDLARAHAAMPFSARWSPAMRAHFAAHSFRALDDGGVAWRYRVAAVQETETALEADMWDRIQVACPSLILRGADSAVFPPDKMARLAALIPGARTAEVADADHRVSQDAPEAMARLLDGFVREAGLAAG